MTNQEDEPEASADELEPVQPSDEASTRSSTSKFSDLGAFEKQYKQLFPYLQSSAFKNFATGSVRASAWLPQINAANRLLSHVKLPTLVNPAALGINKDIVGIIQRQQASIGPFAALFEQQRKQWDSLFAPLRKLTESFFPPNWEGVSHPDFDTIETIAVDEGISLAWIPSADVLQSLFDAPDSIARRQVIGRRWKRIVSDCELVLSEVDHVSLQRHQPFASDIVRALRDGHTSAAQALAANLLDSILRRNFDKDSFKTVTSNKKGGDRFDLNTYRLRTALTLAPIWRSYAEYWEKNGDPIPRSFGRHPSAHAVSRIQYSRINSVAALMLIAALLKLLDRDLER